MAAARWRWWIVGVASLLVVVSGAAAAAIWVTRSAAESEASPAGEGGISPDASSAAPVPCAVNRLVLGVLGPQTGSQAFLGAPGIAAVGLAIDDVNAAGGVLSSRVVRVMGDSGDAGQGLAAAALDDQRAQGVQAIIGPWSAAVALEVIDAAVADGIAMISPGATSPALTTYPDRGLFFRVVPSDASQGTLLAEVAGDLGKDRAATIVRADAYGVGIQQAFAQEFASRGGAMAAAVTYQSGAPSLATAVTQVAEAQPDVVLVAGFEESAAVIREMIRQGVGPGDVQVLLSEGAVSRTAYADLPKDSMTGTLGALPVLGAVAGRKAFQERLLQADPELTTFAYGAEAYDATILAALAAEYAGCADGASIAAALPQVANANPGSDVCSTFADCLEIVRRGDQPNYQGVTGLLDLSEAGEPRAGSTEIVRYSSNTKFRRIQVFGPAAATQ